MVDLQLSFDYRITSERHCWVLSKRNINIAYYTTLGEALKGFLEHNVRASEAKNISSVMCAIKRAQNRCEELGKALENRKEVACYE